MFNIRIKGLKPSFINTSVGLVWTKPSKDDISSVEIYYLGLENYFNLSLTILEIVSYDLIVE